MKVSKQVRWRRRTQTSHELIWRICRHRCFVFATFICSWSDAQAQFGLKCDSPAFAYSLNETKFSEDIQNAIRATCAFNKKLHEVDGTFSKPGWSWDLLPQARADIAELADLAEKAAESNFKTHDMRGLGNIKNIYNRLGSRRRWLADTEQRFATINRKPSAASVPDPRVPSAISDQSVFVYVVFRDALPDSDRDAFMRAYGVSIVDGPNQDRSYRLRLSEPLSEDQMKLVLDSMKSQTNIIETAYAR